MNDTDRFSKASGKTAETLGETEDVKITPSARYTNHEKQWLKLIVVVEVKQGASR